MIGFDTMCSAHLLDEQQSLKLVDQCSMTLGVADWGKGKHGFGLGPGDPADLLEIPHKNKGLGDLWGPEGLGYYCARDTGYTHMLYEKHRIELRDDQEMARLMKFLVLPGLEAFVQIERDGIWLDPVRHKQRWEETLVQRAEMQAELRKKHVDSELWDEWIEKLKPGKDPFQTNNFLIAWLFEDERGLRMDPPKLTPTGRPATDEATVSSLEGPVAESLLPYRTVMKHLQFFEQWNSWLGTDGRMHPSFNITGTRTGRRSSSGPNLQQVPRDPIMRSCFGAPPGWLFLEADYSQVEVRLAAWIANEETMLDIYREGGSGDVYRTFAARIAGVAEDEVTRDQRQQAKAVVLGFLYGLQPPGFIGYAKANYGVDFTLAEATNFRNAYFMQFPGLIRWHEQAKKAAHKDKLIVSPTGRRRHLLDIDSTNRGQRVKAEWQAVNSPVQGLGGDYLFSVIIELFEKMDRSKALVVGDIHDAVLLQIREDVWVEQAREILNIMENPSVMRQLDVEPSVRMLAGAKISTHWGDPAGVEFDLDTLDEVAKTYVPQRAA